MAATPGTSSPRVVLRGTVRCFKPAVQDQTETAMRRVCESIAAAYGATVQVRYARRYPPLVNHAAHIDLCAEVAAEVCVMDTVAADAPPGLGSEEFAFIPHATPGAPPHIRHGP